MSEFKITKKYTGVTYDLLNLSYKDICLLIDALKELEFKNQPHFILINDVIKLKFILEEAYQST